MEVDILLLSEMPSWQPNPLQNDFYIESVLFISYYIE